MFTNALSNHDVMSSWELEEMEGDFVDRDYTSPTDSRFRNNAYGDINYSDPDFKPDPLFYHECVEDSVEVISESQKYLVIKRLEHPKVKLSIPKKIVRYDDEANMYFHSNVYRDMLENKIKWLEANDIPY